jgi:hypothetical protein
MNLFLLFIVILFCITPPAYSQAEKAPLFPSQQLNYPVDNSTWFDSKFNVLYIDNYQFENVRSLCLPNGYAKHTLEDKSNFPLSKYGLMPLRVDVVYTHYPINKHDWRTNYYELLASRVAELIRLDSSLNSTDIEWRFKMQTQCSNEVQAKNLFHGVVVHYSHQVPNTMASLKPDKLPVPIIKPQKFQMYFARNNEQIVLDNSELISILYPESVYNHDLKQHIPVTPKRKNEPGCSKFTTRADRPKQSLWSRLFR